MRADTQYLTTRDLADRWQLSAWTIRDYARRGLISGVVRAGRQFRFTPEASLTLQESSVGAPGTSAGNADTFFADFARRLAQVHRR